MTVKDKVQRAAAAAVLSRLIKYVRKDPDTNLVKLVDRSERFVGNIFPAKNFDSFREGAKDPENVWRQLALRLIDEIDDNVLMNMMLALGLGAGVNGTKTVRANREKYHCNIPWVILLDPTSACNRKCKGCWSAEYGHKQSLTFDELNSIVNQGVAMGTHFYMFTGGEPLANLESLQKMLDVIPTTHKVYINTTFPVQTGFYTAEEMLDFTRRNRDKITCMNISRHLVKYVEESPDQVLGQIACPTRINCVLYKKYPAEKLPQYVERFLPYGIPIQFRYDYTETTPENLYDQDHDPILQDLKRLFTYRGLDGCRMRNGFHFEYKGLHMTYHKTLPYSTIVEKGDDGVTYDILYDILIKQNGEIHSDWTGVKMDVEKYRHVTFEPYDLRVLDGTVDF